MASTVSDLSTKWPRGLNRNAAANYIGVGISKFDELVAGGLMPRPRRIGKRVVWDLRELDAAFDELPKDEPPDRGSNEWDDVLGHH